MPEAVLKRHFGTVIERSNQAAPSVPRLPIRGWASICGRGRLKGALNAQHHAVEFGPDLPHVWSNLAGLEAAVGHEAHPKLTVKLQAHTVPNDTVFVFTCALWLKLSQWSCAERLSKVRLLADKTEEAMRLLLTIVTAGLLTSAGYAQTLSQNGPQNPL
jgi:hypothetical protein